MLDYARHGRQIALPEIGPEGQRRLFATPVAFSCDDPDTRALAEHVHQRAGGRVSAAPCDVVVTIPRLARADASAAAGSAPSHLGPARLALAAWAAIEAARVVSGEPASRAVPTDLLARLR